MDRGKGGQRSTQRDGWTEGWVDRGVHRGAGLVLCILLLPGDVVPGWDIMPRMVVDISDENGEGSVEGQRRVGSWGVMAAGTSNRGTARDSKAGSHSVLHYLPDNFIAVCQ